ncbi:hypothetical protein HPB50_021767 [Hyalomma asiaticum]|uniref:Uncharacterized protein n=1 Tax=Hyalomma asiaticum TaxID=266040 RepID=A0ACB7S176_HYAAI|nr:hypothetical protein HPB50_021767 [Hyalomma asiaticum]
MPTYGVLETFHCEGAAWTEYLERVKLFHEANSVPEEKKKSVFLTCCGASTYSLLRSLLTPRAPDQVSIEDIFSVLTSHFPQSMTGSEAIHIAKKVDKNQTISCYRCGDQHYANACRYAKSRCSACKKIGHLARVCRSSARVNSDANRNAHKPKKKVQEPVRTVTQTSAEDTSQPPTYETWTVMGNETVPPFVAVLHVAGKPLKMELDTGASVSIIGKTAFRQRYPELNLEPSDVMLKSYCGRLTAVRGKVTVPVLFGKREATLPLFVSPDKCPTLLGRDWIWLLI